MARQGIFLLVLLLGLTLADEYHGSAVRSRHRRAATTSNDQTTRPTATPNRHPEEIVISSQGGQIEEGPIYVGEDDEPCEDELRDVLDHNRTKKKRCSLGGAWYNSLGSELILNVSSQGLLTGEYRTAVEKGWGSAGEGSSLVIGQTTAGDTNPTFGMTVIWNEGESVTTWTGQCLICDGVETLETTWVLNTKIDSCYHKWMANRIGQDSFTRKEQRPGPRKSLNTNTPRDFWRGRPDIF